MTRLLLIAALAVASASPSPARAQPISTNFLYKLSSTTGIVPFHGSTVHHDSYHNETLVVGDGRVRIFNPTGMEVYSFGDDRELGAIIAAVPVENGDFLLLSAFDDGTWLVWSNFRGEFKGRFAPMGLPREIPQPFRPNAIGYAAQKIYLADLGGMRLVVLGMGGAYEAHHDLARIADVADKRENHGIKGFRVSPSGEVLFTVQTLFRAFVLAPDGSVRSFGQKGSAPGKFNIISGIAADDKGYYYVADILKSAVLVFDKDLRWVKEFGYRGTRPGNIFAPVDVAAGDGKVYVSQFAKKGVSVFEVKVARVD